MKKFFLFLAASALITVSQAQFKVNSTGDSYIPSNKELKMGSESQTSNRLWFYGHSSSNQLITFYPTLEISTGNTSYYPGNFVIPMRLSHNTNGGSVGIRTWPDTNYAMRINGTLLVNSTPYTSDETLKTNIRNLASEKSIGILSLQAIEYNYKTGVFDCYDKNGNMINKAEKDLTMRNRIGFSAQALKNHFPELVYTDDSGKLAIDYVGLIPVITELLKNQQTQIDELLASNAELKSGGLKSLTSASNTVTTAKAVLYQNVPNPFNNTTEIRCFIPEGSSNAKLAITNLEGKLLKSIDIAVTGNYVATITASEFTAGLYNYALIVDGAVVDVKRMLIQ